MRIISLFLFTSLLFLASCGNKQDYAYNEKIAHDFYGCKERLDEQHANLLDRSYDNDPEAKNLVSFKSYVETVKNDADELKHSELANAFHANIISYMNQISNEYIPFLQNYAKEQDSTKRAEILEQAKSKKIELENLENKCLETQIEFLNKAGIKINKE